MSLTQAKCILILKGLRMLMAGTDVSRRDLDTIQLLHDDIMAEAESWRLSNDTEEEGPMRDKLMPV